MKELPQKFEAVLFYFRFCKNKKSPTLSCEALYTVWNRRVAVIYMNGSMANFAHKKPATSYFSRQLPTKYHRR